MEEKIALELLKQRIINSIGEDAFNLIYYNYYEIIKKGLEVLEILKPRIYLQPPNIFKHDGKEYSIVFMNVRGFVFENSKEYKLLNEWKENEN